MERTDALTSVSDDELLRRLSGLLGRSGRLHLTAIAKLAPHLTLENREALLKRAAHRSRREIEELVAELSPRPDAPAVMPSSPPPPSSTTSSSDCGPSCARRCTARQGLEFHHRHPFGRGGDHSIENVSLACHCHNGFLAEVDYGREAIARHRRSGARPLGPPPSPSP